MNNDQLYLKALKDNNLEDVNNIIQIEAENNGFNILAFHGSNYDFNEFKKTQKNDAGWLGKGFYFYGIEEEAMQYGKSKPFYLKISEIYYIKEEERNELVERDDKNFSEQFTEELINQGYGGVYYNGDLREEYCVFFPENIKSAEIVTYDDNGNIILPSKRFNANSCDIRENKILTFKEYLLEKLNNGKIYFISDDYFVEDEDFHIDKLIQSAYNIRHDINILSNKELYAVVSEDGKKSEAALYISVDNKEFSFDVVVDTDSRRKGYGNILVDLALDTYNEYKEMDIKLVVDVVNPYMVNMLKKKGLSIDEEFNGHTIMTLNENLLKESKIISKYLEDTIKKFYESDVIDSTGYYMKAGSPAFILALKKLIGRDVSIFGLKDDEYEKIHFILKYDNKYWDIMGSSDNINEKSKYVVTVGIPTWIEYNDEAVENRLVSSNEIYGIYNRLKEIYDRVKI